MSMIIFVLALICFVGKSTGSSLPLLLLVSFDGFRWDYPDLYPLVNLTSIVQRGIRLTHIENSFATVTFPSHYTMVTGLFEESHGIVANEIYDPILNDSATIATMNDSKWWSQNTYSQPIWVTNQLGNDSKQRRSGVIAWPGSSTPINGYLPSKYQPYQTNRSFDSILQQILAWFMESQDTRINFGAIYYPEPDATGHLYGPISVEMNKTLQLCDEYIGKLLKMIDSNEYLKTNLNVIITSDHGMHAVEKSHKIILENYIDKQLFSAYGGRAFANIFVHQASDIERIYRNLSKISNYKVYKKSDIPQEYHYTSNVRIGDILIVGDVGYEVILPGDDLTYEKRGDHGYDNRADSMHPIFYAFGPAFRQINRAEAFRNVDLYPLMLHILGLPIRPTNGSLDNVKHILTDFPPENFLYRWMKAIGNAIEEFFSFGFSVVASLALIIMIGLIYTIVACRHSDDSPINGRRTVSRRYGPLGLETESVANLISGDSESEGEPA